MLATHKFYYINFIFTFNFIIYIQYIIMSYKLTKADRYSYESTSGLKDTLRVHLDFGFTEDEKLMVDEIKRRGAKVNKAVQKAYDNYIKKKPVKKAPVKKAPVKKAPAKKNNNDEAGPAPEEKQPKKRLVIKRGGRFITPKPKEKQTAPAKKIAIKRTPKLQAKEYVPFKNLEKKRETARKIKIKKDQPAKPEAKKSTPAKKIKIIRKAKPKAPAPKAEQPDKADQKRKEDTNEFYLNNFETYLKSSNYKDDPNFFRRQVLGKMLEKLVYPTPYTSDAIADKRKKMLKKAYDKIRKFKDNLKDSKNDKVDAKPQAKKSQAQQKRDVKAQEESQRDEFEKSGKIPYNKLDDFYKTIDNIAKGKSRRKEKQFIDVYGKKLMDDVFEGQFGRDFYSTPIKCLDAVSNDFKLNRGANHVLEVSAGLGAMLYWNMEQDIKANQKTNKYTAIEINPNFTKFLKGSFGNKVKVEEGDFFTKSNKYIKPMKGGMNDRGANDFDFILANPPFSLFRGSGKDRKQNKKAYLEFLWRSVKILQQSSKTYEKSILFISPPLGNDEKVGKTIDPYKVWNLSSKPVQKRIQKENNWLDDEIENGEMMPLQIQLVGKCADFGGTGINASIYNIIVY